MILLLLALSLPADFDRASFCELARAIVREAGSHKAAERLARDRGYSPQSIWLAKRICRST